MTRDGANEGRFVIVSAARSGSHLLRSLLASHPAIRCHGELFNPEYDLGEAARAAATDAAVLRAESRGDPARFLARCLARQSGEAHRASGFVLLYGQGDDGAAASPWPVLRRMTSLRVIHLRRHNLLRRYFSFRKALATGVWRPVANAPARNLRLTLTVSECRRDFEQVSHQAREVRDDFRAHPLLTVAYERLVSHRDAELARVQRFLGVPVRTLRSGARAQAGLPLEQAIENYYPLREAFAGSRWSWFFTE